MKEKYKALFTPFRIRQVEIKNRFFMAPMATLVTSDTNGVYTKDSMEYYIERAKGGVGLIITGANWVESDVEKHREATFPSVTQSPDLYKRMAYEMTERIHAFGSKIFVQLTAGIGRTISPDSLKGDCVAPSPVSNHWVDCVQCRELTTQEIEQIVAKFGQAAKIAKESGFDGIEVHAVHEGYMLDCFAMAFFNKRTDKYGGDLRGRLTFAIEILQAVKAACGENYPVIMRFGIKSYMKALKQGGLPGEEFEEIGRDVGEALEAAKILEEAGYDGFDADAGTYDSWYWAHPPMYFDKGVYLPLAEKLKKVVHVPVMVAGRMDDPDIATQALESGIIDAVGLGRPLLSDPQYPNKIKAETFSDIRPCLGCHDGCFTRHLSGGGGSCAVNPECGREINVGIKPSLENKKVVVVGGGPAGMEAARVSALRGYHVVLFENEDRLGGALIIASVPEFKDDDRALIKWYEHQMEKLNVDVRLNTKATRDQIAAINPDIVYIATGAFPVQLKLPGIDQDNVVSARDVLLGRRAVGKKCVIIGGGLVGCELALFLKDKRHEVIIVEALHDILKGGVPIPPMNEQMLRELLAFNNIKILAGACLEKVNASGAVVKVNGIQQIIEADHIIIAVGFKSENSLFEELKYDYSLIYNLGDSKTVRNIRGAIWDAYEVARSI